jgi:hypothetical protein
MRTAILVVWWIGLLGALVPTLVILKESFLVIGALQDILRLARLTAGAARGVAANTVAVPALRGVGDLLRPVDATLGDVAAALDRIATRLDAAAR